MSEVIYYTSDETGAPALTSTAGDMVGLLDACLVNGFNSKTVLAATVASAVCTVQISAHGYLAGRKLLFAGFDTTALNGVKKIAVVDANHVSFPCVGVADQTATGTVTARRAPLGWTKAFGSTTTGIYSRPDVAASAYALRIDDTTTDGYTQASAVLGATGFSTYTERFPTAVQNADGIACAYWNRAGSGAAVRWVLVGDGTSFYLFSDFDSSQHFLTPKGFGDLVSFKVGDAYNAFLGGSNAKNSNLFLSGLTWGSTITVPTNGYGWVAHDYSGFAQSIPISNVCKGSSPMGGGSMFAFPNPVDNGLVFEERCVVMEANTVLRGVPRGCYPGVAEPLAAMGVAFQGITFTANSKDWLAVVFEANGSTGVSGSALLDLTGPWQ